MGRSRRSASVLGAVFAAGLLSGCAGTTHIAEGVTTETLAKSSTAVAVMRIGAASPTCQNVALLLGVRAGEGFRRDRTVQVVNVRSLAEPAVAEIELAPGEYHVIAYSCSKGRDPRVTTDKAGRDDSGVQLYRTSYASFNVAAGEMVNVGYFHINISHVGRNAYGRPLRIDVEVTDWPLAELERYKSKRPQVYAQMTTRLMKVTSLGPHAPTGDECARLREMHKAGKIANLPPSCA